MLLHSIVAHAHLLHPVQACGLINQLAKKLISSLAISPTACVVSIVACFLYGLSKKLAFVPVASAMSGVHRDCLVLVSYAPRPEIQPLESRGQIVFADLP